VRGEERRGEERRGEERRGEERRGGTSNDRMLGNSAIRAAISNAFTLVYELRMRQQIVFGEITHLRKVAAHCRNGVSE
jgi:hypothetical protein